MKKSNRREREGEEDRGGEHTSTRNVSAPTRARLNYFGHTQNKQDTAISMAIAAATAA